MTCAATATAPVLPEMRRLPPIGALEAFVAVAGSGTLTASASELNLSVSAISRRVQALEAHVGTALFERLPHELRLTAAGEKLRDSAAPVIAAFGQLLADVGASPGQRLTVGVPPSFASAWLLPRIAGFRREHPAVELSFDSGGAPLARLGHGLDAAIVFGDTLAGGFDAEVLKPQNAFAVCAPGLVAPGLTPERALADHPFLLHRGLRDVLDCWLTAHGLAGRAPARIDYYDSGPMLVAAAESGLGIALTLEDMVRFYPGTSALVRPFGEAVATDYSYSFVARHGALASPALRRFRDWLFAQMGPA